VNPENYRMNNFFQIEKLSQELSGKTIFKNISLKAKKGDFIAIIGPSGSGKTSLLRTIVGLDRQKSGIISLDDNVLSNNSIHVPVEKRSIGLVIQEKVLFPHLNVLENIKFGLPRNKESEIVAIEMLKTFKIEQLLKKFPHEISGGEAQRAALARSLVMKPKLLLLDEPLNGLDEKLKEKLYPSLQDYLKKNTITTIMVSHNLTEIKILASEVYSLESEGLKKI
tara:strand:- start:35157 stop:35828 length:672 start_codon:yes stop_codon:yes gene_type:complete